MLYVKVIDETSIFLFAAPDPDGLAPGLLLAGLSEAFVSGSFVEEQATTPESMTAESAKADTFFKLIVIGISPILK